MNEDPDSPPTKATKKPSGCSKFFWGLVTLFTLALTLSAQRACHRERQATLQSNRETYATTVWIYDSNFGKMIPYMNAEIRRKGPGFISFVSYGRAIDYSGEYRVETYALPKYTPSKVQVETPPASVVPARAAAQQPPPATPPPPPPLPAGFPKLVTAKWDIEIPLERGKAIVRKGQKFTVYRPLGNGRYEAKFGPIDFTPIGAEFE